ncbi:ANTAR domain-containing protein [Streptomyces bobili]|uniref:ANTAR domain-containing protein n=1 Tax=Streptomyces bobili TaxID=67280 RepID=UPI003442D938
MDHAVDDPAGELAALRNEVHQLRRETMQLRSAMKTRPVVDIARGVVMERYHCSAPGAWKVLVQVSQHANLKLHIVARALAADAGGVRLSRTLHGHLTAAASRVGAGTPDRDDRSGRR